MGCKKQGTKNKVIVIQKREEAAAADNNDPVCCTFPFASHIFDLIFFRVTNQLISPKQEFWVQID